jgi:hypothetical protein
VLSIVHVSPVPDGDHEHDEAIVLNRGDDPEIADAISPKTLQIVCQRVSETARVLVGRNSLTQIAENLSLGLNVKFTQIARGVPVEFNAPGRLASA